MRNKRFTRAIAATMSALMLVQATPGGILTAYAANNGIAVGARDDALKEELAAKAGDYPAGAIAFYEPESTVDEGSGDREVKVVRWGDTSSRASVDVKVFALTATYGEDFEVYTKRGPIKDTLEEKAPEPAPNPEAKPGQAGGAPAQDEAPVTPEQDAETPEPPAAEEKIPFAAADPAPVPAEEPAAAQTEAPAEDGISSMRESYAIQTGNDTQRTNWRGEYEESIAPIAAAAAANDIASALPGAAGTLTFEPGEYVKSVFITVKDDDRAESTEAFKLLLGNVSTGVLGEQLQHNVTIEDNEAAERIAFAMRDAEVTVEPGAEYAEVTVERTSGTDYYAGAVLSTAAGTATPETAYEPVDGGTVAFASGATEQAVRIALKDTAQAGTEFIVRLDDDASNVDGNAQTVVKIAEQAADPVEAPEVGPEPQVPMAVPSAKNAAPRTAPAPRYEHKGIVYDGVTVNVNKRASCRGVDVNANFTYTNNLSHDASRIVAKIWVNGYTDWGAFNVYGKNWTMVFGDRRLIDSRDLSKKEHTYTEQFNISYNEGQTGGLWLNVNTDGGNHQGMIELKDITYYFPRYTVVMDDADYVQKLKGRNYTSLKDSTTFDVDALTRGFSDRTATVAREGHVDIAPAGVNPGVIVDHYEVYCGNKKVGETTSGFLPYSTLSSFRKNNDDLMRNNKYKVRIKPVYRAMSAKVTFESQDPKAVAFSGDVPGKKGFKVGDVLRATRIDTVTMTAECPSGQKIKPRAIAKYNKAPLLSFFGSSSSMRHVRDYKADGKLAFTVNKAEITHGNQIFRAMHGDASLTYAYTPSEAGAVNAGVGAIAAYDAKDLDKPIGVSNYRESLTLRDTLDMVAGKNYVARVIKGDGFQDGTIVAGVPYSTRTIWTYTDPKTGQKVSTTGNAFMFDPYYGDEVVNYHFKSVQDDARRAGVEGTVYIKEKPLFSANAKQTSKPAVGVMLDVGGENVKTDQSGVYRVSPKFNKGDYVSAFLNYDSLTMMGNVAISEDTVKDFYINVDENDGIKVTGSSISKLVNTNEKDMHNKVIFEDRPAQAVLLEDTTYTFNVSANGSAGIVPAKAEFRFYDKKGNLLPDKTKTVDFAGNTASLKLNPSSHALSVGDSMTVKLYDARGRGYFEHQTSVIVGKKAEGIYTFNYEGIKREDDNLFLKAIGGISMGYDFILDMLSGNAGTYEDEQGNQHQLTFLGFGDGFQNQGGNAEHEVYNTLQQAVANIDEVNTGAYNLNANDSLAFFGSGSWSFNIRLGIIYDMVMEDSGDRKGEFKFNDYLMMVDASAGYNKEWKVPVGPVKLTFNLQFGFGDPGNGTSGVSVKWHFYDPDDQGYFVESNSAIDLLADKNIRSKGYFGFDSRVLGSLRAEFLGELVGGEGVLTVQVGNRTGFDSEKWNDYGEVLLQPKLKLVVLGIGIPVWSQTWRHEWEWQEKAATAEASDRMMRAIDEGLSPEKVLFTSTDEGVQEDYSYADRRSGWNAGAGAGLFRMLKGAEATGDKVLQKGFLADSEISLHNLGSGKYLAAFLDVAPGRDDANKMAAYYTVYNGSSWSDPIMLHDDDTADQVPVISDAGDAGVLIAWSSAADKLDGNADLSSRLNTFNIQGAFYKDGKLGKVQDITKNTGKDAYADTNPQAVRYEKDGKQLVKLYYTKSEFKVSDTKQGEVVGDILNPDQLTLAREYDIAKDEWVESYDAKTEQGIREKLKGSLTTPENPNPSDEQVNAAYEQYCKDWYGQVFLDLAPAVDVTEHLNDEGFWTGEPTITPLDPKVASARMVKDSAAIAYNGLGLLAYSLDKGGMAQTTGDQNLYLQIFNAKDNEYHHPVMISGANAELGDIQFVRSTYQGADGASHEITWLYWKEQVTSTVEGDDGEPIETSTTSIKRINVSALVGERDANLIKDEVDGKPYYYINKAAGNDKFAPEQTIVSSTPMAEDGESFLSIGNFQIRASADGRYSYTAWTQPVTTGEGDATRQELQLFVVREDLHTGEVSAPVQVTDKADQYLTEFDFAVTGDGNLDVLTGRQTLKEQAVRDESGKDTGVKEFLPDPATSELAFLQVTPAKSVSIDAVVEGGLQASGKGADVELVTKVRNESFDSISGVNVTAVDANGKTVFSSKDESFVTFEGDPAEGPDGGVNFDDATAQEAKRGLIKLGGGEVHELALRVPVSKDGAYDVTIKVTAGGTELASKRVKGQVPLRLTSTPIDARVIERDRIELTATVSNNTALASAERTVAYGYLDAEGERNELGTAKLKAMEPGGEEQFRVELDQDFAEFESKKGSDGSLTDSRTYYLDLEPAGKAAKGAKADEGVIDPGDNAATMVFGTVSLTATASEVELMGRAAKLGAVPVADDGEGGIGRAKRVDPGQSAYLGLTVDGELAQQSDAYVNRLRVVWDEVDTGVATVDPDGLLHAKRAGSVKLTGKVMPASTATDVSDGGTAVELDNYAGLPASLIKPIEVTVRIGADLIDDQQGGAGQQGAGQQQGAGHGSSGKLPGTGDAMSPVYLMVITAAGATLVAAGARTRRRIKQKGQ